MDVWMFKSLCIYLFQLAAMPAWDKLFRRPWLMKRMSNDVTNESVKCCPLGYKTEWKVSPDGEEYLHHFCTNTMACCSGLKEVLRIKSDGLNYSICVKDPVSIRTYDNSELFYFVKQ